MSLQHLRILADDVDAEPFREGHDDDDWSEIGSIQRHDPDYVPTIYFDPARFDRPDAIHRLEWLVRSMRPAGEDRTWNFEALTPETLKLWSPFTSGKLEKRFLVSGYLTDLDRLPGKPGFMGQAREAMAAFAHAAAVADAVIRAVQERLGADCPPWLAESSKAVLEPMTGNRTLTAHNEQGQVVHRPRVLPLVEHRGLLFGCCNFFEPRTVMASKHWVVEPVLAEGRSALLERQHHPDELFQSFIRGEIAELPRRDLPGIALWACQQVALARMSASEASWWTSPERCEAVEKVFDELTLTQAFDRGYRSWCRVVKDLRPRGRKRRLMVTGLRFPTDQLRPALGAVPVVVSALERCWKTVDDKIITDIGTLYGDDWRWERPIVRHVESTLRREVEIAFMGGWVRPAMDRWDAPGDTLYAIARWLGELRRWGRRFLDPAMAALVLSVMEGGWDEEEEHIFGSQAGQDAIAFLDSLMPPEFWADVARVVQAMAADARPVPVVYQWTPADPAQQIWRSDNLPALIITQGRYVAFPFADAAEWADKAATIGPEGLLVI